MMAPAMAPQKRRIRVANTTRIALVCVSAMAFGIAGSNPLLAQGKAGPAAGQMTQKTIDENDKVSAIDIVAKPGDTSPMQTRPMRVVYFITGGTFERTYKDGKKEVVPEKAGVTKIINVPQPYSLKNIGKTTIHLIEVNVK
jgi:quercetin dioxygenase-like cupin family protein